MQVYQLAKERGIQAKDLIQELKSEGFDVKSLSGVTDEMLKAIDVSEKPKDVLMEPQKLDPESNGKKYYWAKSERLTLGGLKPEKRGIGFLEPDKAIQFENHVYITGDADEQVFIEGTRRFSLGDIKEITEEKYGQQMEELAQRRIQMREQTQRVAGIQR